MLPLIISCTRSWNFAWHLLWCSTTESKNIVKLLAVSQTIHTVCCEDDYFPKGKFKFFLNSLFRSVYLVFTKSLFSIAYLLVVCYLWVECNEDKCCVVTQRAADIHVAWLVYARTYCVPIATLNLNKRTRLLFLGDAQIITKHAKKIGFHAWCDMEERILETRDESSGSVLYNKPILWLPQTRCNMSRVLVTGASGYLAMHVVKQLVDSREYIVRGTVRSLANETKVKPLKELSSENDKYPLELVEADLTKKETWVEWVIISKGLFISKQVENNADMNERRFGVI